MPTQTAPTKVEPAKKNHLERQPQPPVSVGLEGAVSSLELGAALSYPPSTRPEAILQLQRMAGNRAVSGLIQRKLTVGAANDPYEQEADLVAAQVMSMPESMSKVQRMDEEQIQAKPLAATVTPLVQRTSENRINQILGRNGAQEINIPRQQSSFFGITNVIQRTLYETAEHKAKNHEVLTETELANAVKEFLKSDVVSQSYKDAFGGLISPESIQALPVNWGSDYAINPFGIDLPSVADVTNQILNGTFKMTLRHEISHLIRSQGDQTEKASFDTVEGFLAEYASEIEKQNKEKIEILSEPKVNKKAWIGDKYQETVPKVELIASSRKDSIEAWTEELRADLKSIELMYKREKRYPDVSELHTHEKMLGALGHDGMDHSHPPAKMRANVMKAFVAKEKEREDLEAHSAWSQENWEYDKSYAQKFLSTLPIQQASNQGNSFEPSKDFESRLSASQGGGYPLPARTRQFMEQRFAADFSGVRVHTGGESAKLNNEISALAFTRGQDIYLGEGKENIENSAGKQLLAHELTHVIQQRGQVDQVARWGANGGGTPHTVVTTDGFASIPIEALWYSDRVREYLIEHSEDMDMRLGFLVPVGWKIFVDQKLMHQSLGRGMYETPKQKSTPVEKQSIEASFGIPGPIVDADENLDEQRIADSYDRMEGYGRDPGEAPNHAEAGLYRRDGTTENITRVNAYINTAVEAWNSNNRHQAMHTLSLALHAAQDRGAHGDGKPGLGHDPRRVTPPPPLARTGQYFRSSNPGWRVPGNPVTWRNEYTDNKLQNPYGYVFAVQQTGEVLSKFARNIGYRPAVDPPIDFEGGLWPTARRGMGGFFGGIGHFLGGPDVKK